MNPGRTGTAVPRRQIALFLLAVMLPCLVVVALGFRVVAQDRELAETRAADERRRIVADVRRQLMDGLDTVAASASAEAAREAAKPDVLVLVAPIDDGRMLLPWESNPPRPGLSEQVERARTRPAIDEGERLEVQAPAAAAVQYRRALESSDRTLSTLAKFSLARVLRRSGQQAEADALDGQIAAESFDITDDYGVPFAIYAAQRLENTDQLPRAFFDHSRVAVQRAHWLSPTAAYALRAVALQVTARPSASDAKPWAAEIERLAPARIDDANLLVSLQKTVAANLPRLTEGERASSEWFVFGSPSWLASIVSRNERRLAVVVDAAAVLASLPATPNVANRRLVDDAAPGEVLGAGFAGVRFAYTFDDQGASASALRLRRWFYLAALAMVVSLTMLGAYLLLRDARRERRIADLRAQFVASVSHELRTPLTSVRMFADTLRMGRGLDEGTRTEYLDTIVSETERLTRLLNNVLDFSKIEQQKKTYRLTPTSLPDVVRASARAMAYPLAQAGFELQLRINDNMPPVQADADALEQAVLNLVANAMKYSGASRHVDLALDCSEDRAVISVTDRGIGIAPQDHARVFERFYRVPMLAGQQIAGTGLGLTIVQHIVEAHHGSITLRSAPGAGATFSIALPLDGRPRASDMA